jgi:hypothetical protein
MSEALWVFAAVMIGGAVYLFLLWAFLNFLSKGFFNAWVRARMSRGKKWLVRVLQVDGDSYFVAGTHEENQVRYKARNGEWRLLTGVTTDCVTRAYGTTVLETYDGNHAIKSVSSEGWAAVSGTDVEVADSLYRRALDLGSAGSLEKKLLLFMLLLLLVVGGIGLANLYLALTAAGGGTII